MLTALRTSWNKKKVAPEWAGMFAGHPDELVSLDCETTSLNVREAEILSIGAVKIRDGKVLTSQSFEVLVKPEHLPESSNVVVHGLRPKDLSDGIPPLDAVRQLLDFIGGRALVGYYLEYDVAVLNKYVRQIAGVRLPQRQVEVSGLYYDWKLRQTPDGYVDLRLQSILDDLHIPTLARHDALNDSITAAMVYLAMQQRKRG